MRRLLLLMVVSACWFPLFTGCSGGGGGSSSPVPTPAPSPPANAVPSVASIGPPSAAAGAAAQTITVTGTGFVASSVIAFNGTNLQTTFASATSLQAVVPASSLSAGETATITVSNPAPGGGLSAPTNFNVVPPTPSITALLPSAVPQGVAIMVTVSGTGFEANSSVLWNGSARSTAFVSGTSLQVALTAADVQSAGTGQITVNNPGPGGTATTPTALTVVAPLAITSLSPATVAAGAASQTLTVTGTGFVPSSIVALDGTSLQTSFTNATTLQAAVSAAALAAGRVAVVTVTNPAPNPGVSSAASFNITSPTPTLTAITPGSVQQGLAATITATGTGFEANSAVLWNGVARPTTFVSSTSLKVALTAIDLQSAGAEQITVNDPGPGGSTTAPLPLTVLVPPSISSVTPSTIPVSQTSNAPVSITVAGANFSPKAAVVLNGLSLAIASQTSTQITAAIPGSYLYSSGSLRLVVTNPPLSLGDPALSSTATFIIVINPTASFSISPAAAPAGSPDTKISVYGQGFFADSVVLWNGAPLSTTYGSGSYLTAIIPASLLATLGTAVVGIATPENLGQFPPTVGFSTFLSLPTNDLVWNAKDSLIYATVSSAAGPGLGNSLVGIDPNTGVIQKTIFVGSEPNRLALSDDGTQAFVGLDGAGAVRQVNLQTATAGVQFSLGGGNGIYNPPYLAESLAAVPGQPNSVAVYASSGVVTLYDSGVARPKTSQGLQTYFSSNYGGLAFGGSASNLFVSSEAIGSYVYNLTVDATGITAANQLNTSGSGRTLQYDKARLYFPVGIAADATTGATLGQFSTASSYSSGTVAATGPIFSDSTLNRAWVVSNTYSSTSQILGFDETTFNQVSSLPIAGLGIGNSFPSNPADLIRWGQSGLAFHTGTQLYVVQGLIVKDTSGSPADLAVSAQVASTASTGSTLNYQFQVVNHGPNPALGATLIVTLPASVSFAGATTSQGSCAGSGVLYCDLGTLANGATATITLTGTPSIAGTFTGTGIVAAQSYDPTAGNNQTTVTTVVSGSLVSAPPAVTQIAPNLVAAGAGTLTLTVQGSGFTTASSVLWNGTSLPTTFVNTGQLTATVDASLVQTLGWAQVSVSTAAPGGGLSGSRTLSIYNLLKVPANAMTWDPFTRKLYAALPSTATAYTGNSLVAVDPATGNVGTPIAVGSEPNLLAETSSGNYLYIGLSGAQSLGRFSLLTQSLDLTTPLTSTSYFGNGPVAATGLATLPGVDSSVSVTGVGIIDFAGTTATVRRNTDVGYSDAIFTDPTHFYTYDNYSSGAEFYRYSVDANGIELIDGTTLDGFGGFSGGFAVDGGLVYASAGGIVNPSTTPPSQVGVLPLGNGPYGSSLLGAGSVPYAAEQKSFNVGINTAGTAMTFLERFDTLHFTLEDQVQLPSSAIGPGVRGTRWGQDGLAFILPTDIGGTAPPQILVLRGPFVLPAEAATNPAPTLTAAGSGTLAVGSGNQQLSIMGTGLLPGASALWNGTILNTTYVDAQHLTAAVGAQDVKAAGTVSLTLRNPASGASNALWLSIQ